VTNNQGVQQDVKRQGTMLKTLLAVTACKPPALRSGTGCYCEHQPRQALSDPARHRGSSDTRQTGWNQRGCGLAQVGSSAFGGLINHLSASDLWCAEADEISKWGERLERIETEISPMQSCISHLDVAKLFREQYQIYSRSLREYEIPGFLE